MRISISWSGSRSHRVALLLSKWLPAVVQGVTPFVAVDENKRGTAWFKALKDQLKQIDFGIVCLSRENLNVPWLLFEAGVLSTRFDKSHVYAVLIGDLTETDLGGPLANFQTIKLTDREDMRKLVQIINQMHGTRMLSANALNSAFERRWTILEDACRKATEAGLSGKEIDAPKSEHQLLEEISGLCVQLVGAMGAMSDDIKDLKNDLVSRNIIAFPQKEIRKV